MSVPPSLVHLCPGQHPSGSPGRHQTQVGRGTKKGFWCVLPVCVLVPHRGGHPIPDQWACCLSKQQMCSSSAEEEEVVILTHPRIPDVLLLPVNGPRYVRNAGTPDESALWAEERFPFNCRIGPTAGRPFPETRTEYIWSWGQEKNHLLIPAVHTQRD